MAADKSQLLNAKSQSAGLTLLANFRTGAVSNENKIIEINNRFHDIPEIIRAKINSGELTTEKILSVKFFNKPCEKPQPELLGLGGDG